MAVTTLAPCAQISMARRASLLATSSSISRALAFSALISLLAVISIVASW
jgi:hypothetical protein